MEFPTTNDRTAYALYYPPANPHVERTDGELPPLLVQVHGGPTGAFDPTLSIQTQYWTRRGFAVAAVNYSGSTGYGRACRPRLGGGFTTHARARDPPDLRRRCEPLRRGYQQRSSISHVEGFDRPLIVLQGLEDEVVPPDTSQMIIDALRGKVPVAYVPFEGEPHGFRQAANIRRALDSELSFYAQIFGFSLSPDEGIEPVPVENLWAQVTDSHPLVPFRGPPRGAAKAQARSEYAIVLLVDAQNRTVACFETGSGGLRGRQDIHR